MGFREGASKEGFLAQIANVGPVMSGVSRPIAGSVFSLGVGNMQDQSAGNAARPARPWLLWLGIALVVVVVTVVAAWAMILRPINVQAAAAVPDVQVQVFGLGTVEARVTSDIGFQVPGVLVDLGADVGNLVVKGAILARLDDREQNAQVARANASVALADANLQMATASLDKAQANSANAKSISERQQSLLKNSSTSIEAAETAQAAQDAAIADVGVAQSAVLVAKANIQDAQAQQNQQSTILNFYTLTAPYDAMVTGRLKELGSALGTGQPVLRLIDPTTVWVLAYIDESKVGEIKLGDPAEIVLRSSPDRRLSGRVARIEPESDRVNEERKVEVAFDAVPVGFNIGEQAEVYITTVRLAKALLVPEAAVIGLGTPSQGVWTVEGGQLHRRAVTLGHHLLDGRYEITGGVPGDALVVTRVSSGLRIGRAVKVADGAER
jgi:HlyD family secretion protein